MGYAFEEYDGDVICDCDICGELHSYGDMYELEDGRIICEDCMVDLEAFENTDLP